MQRVFTLLGHIIIGLTSAWYFIDWVQSLIFYILLSFHSSQCHITPDINKYAIWSPHEMDAFSVRWMNYGNLVSA